jgi:hypothetical protein
VTASIIERVPLDRITEQARRVRFWRTVLAVVAGVLYGAGWLTAKACGLVWLAVVWSVTAVRVGWQEGRGVRVGHGSARPR